LFELELDKFVNLGGMCVLAWESRRVLPNCKCSSFSTFKIKVMSHFLEQPGLFDHPIRLGPAERREPFRVLEGFFTDYRLHEWRHHLWNIIETCLGTDNDAFAEPDERANLLQHYKDLEELLEAVWLLVEERGGESGVAPVAGPKGVAPGKKGASSAGGTGKATGMRVVKT
jgi:hypothetical protein